MKKLLLLTGIFLISFRSAAQEFKESDLDKLFLLPGKVNTYYSKGCETKAKYLQELTQDAVTFFENKLQDTFDIRLLVLNRRDWKLLIGGPYIIAHFEREPDRIEMGINELYKIKLPEDIKLYGRDEVFYWDFLAVHELGHYISIHKKIKGIGWTKEFFANYICVGFLLERIPDYRFPSSGNISFKLLPFKYKSLKDFEGNYSRIDPVNLIMYQAKLTELAYNIFEKRGWDFMYEYIDRFTNIIPPPDGSNLLELTVAEYQKIEPEIFNDWLNGMRKSYHPFLIFCILIAIIVGIRALDNSFGIFTRFNFPTKKKYKIFGVPAIVIISKLKSLENSKIKRKLKLIMWLRPLMYLCFILIILLFVLHH